VGGKCQLKVIKTDGSSERYLHTKVIGTISNVLASIDQADVYVAEELAEAVTYFLYHKHNRHSVSSSEIFSIIKAVLTTTGYQDAAIALSEHHFQRRLNRSRVEVISADVRELADAELLAKAGDFTNSSRWDKSKIANDLVNRRAVDSRTARVISSIVEQRVFNLGLALVPTSLIKQLVLTETAAVLRAQRQLQTI